MTTAGNRPRTPYRFVDHAQGQAADNFGSFIVRSNAAKLYKLAYRANGQNDGLTTLRILPSKTPADYADPNSPWVFTPFRNSSRPQDFGDWIRCYPGVDNFGMEGNGATYLVSDGSSQTLDRTRIPSYVLHQAVKSRCDARQDPGNWGAFIRGGDGRGAEISGLKDLYFVQAVLMHRNKPLTPPVGIDDKPVLIQMSKGAAFAMMEKLEELVPNNNAAEGDWANMYVNGDAVSLNPGCGRYITFYRTGDGDPRTRPVAAYGAQPAAPLNAPATFDLNNQSRLGTRNTQHSTEANGYSCFVEPNYGQYSADLSNYQQQLFNTVKPFEDILHFPSIEEQLAILSTRVPPDMLEYAFSSIPEFWTDDIRSKVVNRVIVPPPAAGWGLQGAVPGMVQPNPFGAAMPMGFPASTFGAPQSNYGLPMAPAAPAPPPGQGGLAPMAPAAPPAAAVPAAPVSPFGQPFGQPAAAPVSPFGQPQGTLAPVDQYAASPFGQPQAPPVAASPFGQPSAPPVDQFGQPQQQGSLQYAPGSVFPPVAATPFQPQQPAYNPNAGVVASSAIPPTAGGMFNQPLPSAATAPPVAVVSPGSVPQQPQFAPQPQPQPQFAQPQQPQFPQFATQPQQQFVPPPTPGAVPPVTPPQAPVGVQAQPANGFAPQQQAPAADPAQSRAAAALAMATQMQPPAGN